MTSDGGRSLSAHVTQPCTTSLIVVTVLFIDQEPPECHNPGAFRRFAR